MAIEKAVDILVSDELIEILKLIETQSLVASLLLRGRHTDDALVESPVNFISVGMKDKSKISYISQDRIDALKEDDSPWTTTRRYMAKPGAFVSKLFNDIPSKEIENFSNLFLSITHERSIRMEIVKGEDIKQYYLYESYSSGNGSLGVSCMKHEHCQNYFSLYTENSDILSMLVMLNEDDKLLGRALLWDFEGHKIMDRIYTVNDEMLSFKFKQWATDKDYLYKSEQNWYNTLYFENIKVPKCELKIDLKPSKWNQYKYPYMDTFKFFNSNLGTFSNYFIEKDRGYITVLTSSDGGQNGGDHLVFDDISKVYRYRNDAANVVYDGMNIWTSRQNVNYSNINDMWILNDDVEYNDDVNDYIFNKAKSHLNCKEVFNRIERRELQRKERNTISSNTIGIDLETSETMYGNYDNYGYGSSFGFGGRFSTSIQRRGRSYGIVDPASDTISTGGIARSINVESNFESENE